MLGQKILCIVGALILVLSPSINGYPIEELKKEADRLRVLYEQALEQDIQSEREPAEQQGRERVYAQHERVKSHKDYTTEERKKAELEHILAIAKLMGRDIEPVEAPTVAEPDDGTLCHDDGVQGETMTYGDLKEMIDATHRVFDLEFFTQEHYIATSYGLYRVVDSDQVQGLRPFFNRFRNTSPPNELWMTNTPCVTCAHVIMASYNRSKAEDKPTIYIGNVTAGATLKDTVESFKCMARMVHEGFTLAVWDWNDFRGNLSSQACQNGITTALNNEGFMAAKADVERLIEYIRNTSTSAQIMSWCPPS